MRRLDLPLLGLDRTPLLLVLDPLLLVLDPLLLVVCPLLLVVHPLLLVLHLLLRTALLGRPLEPGTSHSLETDLIAFVLTRARSQSVDWTFRCWDRIELRDERCWIRCCWYWIRCRWYWIRCCW